MPEKTSLHVQTPIEDLLDSNQNIALDVKKEINYVIDSTTFDNRVLMVYGMHTKTQRYTYGNGVIGLDSWNDKATEWEDINQKKHDEQLYYVKDFRGSVIALTDYKCKITTTYDYNAFGIPSEKNHVNDQGIRSNIYHYAGYIYDYTTSLCFVNARYYMPETARFMAEDIYRGDGLNRYVYVRNNPLVFIDPMGLCGEGAEYTIIDSTGSALLGVLSALIENVKLSTADVFGIICSMFGREFGLKIYQMIHSGGDNLQGNIEYLATDKVAYYTGKTVGDIALVGVGLAGTITAAGTITLGLGEMGGGLLVSPLSGGASLLVTAAGAATTAIGVTGLGLSLSLAVSASGNFNKDFASLKAAIDDAKSGGGTDNKGTGKTTKTNLGNEIDVTPSKNHSTTTKNPGLEGKPNSSVDILDSNGNIKTRRWFGSDGGQVRDVDFTNHGNPKNHPEWPHDHGPR